MLVGLYDNYSVPWEPIKCFKKNKLNINESVLRNANGGSRLTSTADDIPFNQITIAAQSVTNPSCKDI